MYLKGIIKEVLTYKSGVLGVTILALLIAISITTIITIPYDRAIELWRGEEKIWIENPRNALPTWVKFLTGRNLPENIIKDTEEGGIGIVKAITPLHGTDIKKLYIEISFDYHYDDFPSEINIFFKSIYKESAPILKIYWVKPDKTSIKILDYVLRYTNDTLYLTINPVVSRSIRKHLENVVNGSLELVPPINVALFIIEDSDSLNSGNFKLMKGRYKLIIEGLLFGKDSDLDVRLIVYGKVWGLAGTDNLRRDLMIALLWGTPVALAFGLTASIVTTIASLIIATISAYYGGIIDSIIQRSTEIMMILPFLPFLIMIDMFYELDIWRLLLVIIALSILGAGIKSTRALVLQVKEYPYIEAAKAYGASSWRIIFLYIIPKILPPVVPGMISAVPVYVFLEAALAMLGLGDPYIPTWGKVIYDAYIGGAMYKGYYYWVLEPAALLILTAFAFASLGFTLDKIVNPKLREL